MGRSPVICYEQMVTKGDHIGSITTATVLQRLQRFLLRGSTGEDQRFLTVREIIRGISYHFIHAAC
jgi:hypothetical protein